MRRTAFGARMRVASSVAPGLGRVVDRDRLAGEQQRAVEVLLDERLAAEPLRESLRRVLGPSASRASPRCASARPRRRPRPRAGRPRRRATPAAAGWSAGARRLPLGRPLGVDERALELVQLQRVLVAPVERSREARTRDRARLRRGPPASHSRAARRCSCRRRPSASSSIQSRRRGHSRSSASWATSTTPSPTVTRRCRRASRARPRPRRRGPGRAPRAAHAGGRRHRPRPRRRGAA